MDNFWWKVIGAVISIVAIIVPSYVAYDIYQKGSISKHALEVKKLFSSNPASFLSDLDGKFQLIADGEKVKDLRIIYFSLSNTGNKPILPKQIHERLNVSVDEKWKIVGVSNENSYPKGMELSWSQDDSGKYYAERALINPGDNFTVAVYMVGDSEYHEAEGTPSVSWSGRIENLSQILVREPEKIEFKLSGITVLLSGWALPFTVVSFMVLLGMVLILSKKAGVTPNIAASKIALIVVYSALAISASEVLAYYIYEPIKMGGEEWINWSVLVVQSMVLLWLSFLLIKKKGA
jgi:hypothetical protein